jgi:hypothetical protein
MKDRPEATPPAFQLPEPMSKRERERAILGMVYDLSRLSTVLDRESPDFELRHAIYDDPFGVEVT